jgi:hypothetical protein
MIPSFQRLIERRRRLPPAFTGSAAAGCTNGWRWFVVQHIPLINEPVPKLKFWNRLKSQFKEPLETH